MTSSIDAQIIADQHARIMKLEAALRRIRGCLDAGMSSARAIAEAALKEVTDEPNN